MSARSIMKIELINRENRILQKSYEKKIAAAF
jgi:hypothetical protein